MFLIWFLVICTWCSAVWRISCFILQLKKKHTSESEVWFHVQEGVSLCMCVQQMWKNNKGTDKVMVSFAYPVSLCGPGQETRAEVSSLLWFPPGSAHAGWEEAESAASAYELTPSTVDDDDEWKDSSWQRLISGKNNNWHRQTGSQQASSSTPPHLRQWPAETAPAQSDVRALSTDKWWTQRFTELQQLCFTSRLHCFMINNETDI